MKLKQIQQLFDINDIHELPQQIMNILFGDPEVRDSLYKRLLQANNYDMSYDWFQEAYEEELAQRKVQKQDFTPQVLGALCTEICGVSGSVYEPTAGNGSMLISNWHKKLEAHYPWEFLPSENQFECWELSDRSIPILLLNLSIRGMMGVVYHGDVLEKKVKQKYIILNEKDDCLAFSSIHKVTNNAIIRKRPYDI